MLETWTDTVLVLMKSCLPISPLERPSATRARISASRGVSVAVWAEVAGVGAEPGPVVVRLVAVYLRVGDQAGVELAVVDDQVHHLVDRVVRRILRQPEPADDVPAIIPAMAEAMEPTLNVVSTRPIKCSGVTS